MSRRLLAVSKVMPPLVYPRAIQVSRTLKMLARRGWTIDMVTVHPDSDASAVRDQAFANCYDPFYALHWIDIPRKEAPAPLPPEPRGLRHLADAVVRRLLFRQQPPPPSPPPLPPAPEPVPFSEDDRRWEEGAAARIEALIRESHPDAFVTFAQPWINHVLGLGVKERHPHLPWIAHFSDPWVDSPYYADTPQKVMDEWRLAERSVVAHADRLIFVNERTAGLVMGKYDPKLASKVSIVPHGYDTDLLDGIAPEPLSADSRCTFVYTGNLFSGLREPLALLDAMAHRRKQCPDASLPDVHFVGNTALEYEDRVRALSLSGHVTFQKSVGYLDAIRWAAAANVLVTIDASFDESVFLPSKVADYLMFGKPILAITPAEGAAADVLRPLGHLCVEPDDIEGLSEAIANLSRQYEENRRLGQAATGLVPPAAFDIRQTAAAFEQAVQVAIDERPRA